MFTVALVGGDGAGKTTIARHLKQSLPWRVKYVYMGPSTVSGNLALPTTRFARFIKLKIDRNSIDGLAEETKLKKPTSNDLHYGKRKRNFFWILARLLNRMLEASWRQLFSWNYLLRGYMVLYDRHLLFDAAPRDPSKVRFKKWFNHVEYWILNYLFPKPNLVIFLDAPPEVLYGRKGEASIKHLNSRREATLKQGERTKNFVRVDASLPFERVLDEVTLHIIEYEKSWNSKKLWRFRSDTSQ